jgi:hypothetical protein
VKGDQLKLVAAIAIVLLLMGVAVQLQAARERNYPGHGDEDASLYLTSGAVARRLAFVSPTLAADAYWIRAIQYYGGTKRRLLSESDGLAPPPILAADPSAGYPLLYPLLDLTTALDPYFNVAYRFGAIFLAEPYPNGPGRPDLAIALLEKGLRARSDKWEYMEDIGFVHYWYRHDYRLAAAWFDRAGRVSGAPWWLQSLAAVTLAQGGDRRTSRQMWEAIRQSAEVDWLRKDAERRLVQLRALDEIDTLQKKIASFGKQSVQGPLTWAALTRAGVVPGVMVDPAGTPYELSPDGTVHVASSSLLWPLPEEPQALIGRPPS